MSTIRDAARDTLSLLALERAELGLTLAAKRLSEAEVERTAARDASGLAYDAYWSALHKRKRWEHLDRDGLCGAMLVKGSTWQRVESPCGKPAKRDGLCGIHANVLSHRDALSRELHGHNS